MSNRAEKARITTEDTVIPTDSSLCPLAAAGEALMMRLVGMCGDKIVSSPAATAHESTTPHEQQGGEGAHHNRGHSHTDRQLAVSTGGGWGSVDGATGGNVWGQNRFVTRCSGPRIHNTTRATGRRRRASQQRTQSYRQTAHCVHWRRLAYRSFCRWWECVGTKSSRHPQQPPTNPQHHTSNRAEKARITTEDTVIPTDSSLCPLAAAGAALMVRLVGMCGDKIVSSPAAVAHGSTTPHEQQGGEGAHHNRGHSHTDRQLTVSTGGGWRTVRSADGGNVWGQNRLVTRCSGPRIHNTTRATGRRRRASQQRTQSYRQTARCVHWRRLGQR